MTTASKAALKIPNPPFNAFKPHLGRPNPPSNALQPPLGCPNPLWNASQPPLGRPNTPFNAFKPPWRLLYAVLNEQKGSFDDRNASVGQPHPPTSPAAPRGGCPLPHGR